MFIVYCLMGPCGLISNKDDGATKSEDTEATLHS